MIIICRECGKREDVSRWGDSIENDLVEKQLCFYCDFWIEKINIKDKPNVARINNNHYVIEPNNAFFKGYGGQEFTIKFNDGKIVTTHNLWYQGKIPEIFRDRLPNNAKFITPKKSEYKTA